MNNVAIINRGGESPRLKWLSTLRGLAILLVFISHLKFGDEWKNELFILGRIGVVIFLMMAGYLAYGAVMRKTRRQFAVNRLLRIYPIFWILLLMTYMLHPDTWTTVELLKNMTLFQEYIGADCILGASWMLSIMIIFFGILCCVKNRLKQMIPLVYGTLATAAVLCATARYLIGMPFPTALFLLQMIGLIGCISKKENKALSPKELRYIMIFELTLAIAAPLSYPNWWAYLLAYNIGILLFYIFKNFNLANHYATSFSRVGFTFFLGAQIPIYAITLICPNVASLPFCVIVLLTFLSTLLFAWLMTRYVEEPLLKWGKRVMKE